MHNDVKRICVTTKTSISSGNYQENNLKVFDVIMHEVFTPSVGLLSKRLTHAQLRLFLSE